MGQGQSNSKNSKKTPQRRMGGNDNSELLSSILNELQIANNHLATISAVPASVLKSNENKDKREGWA